jgi:hypothetical protein
MPLMQLTMLSDHLKHNRCESKMLYKIINEASFLYMLGKGMGAFEIPPFCDPFYVKNGNSR